MKKVTVLSIVITVILMLVFAISINGAEIIDGISYDLNSYHKTANLTKNGNQTVDMETVIIPEKVIGADGNEYTVTVVNEGSFRENPNIKYVSLPKTITSIGGGAFYGCKNLVFVDFNDNQNNLNMQSWGVFRNCTSLKAVCLPDNIKILADQAFTGCTELTAVYLPANVEYIKGNKNDGPAFGNCPYMYLVNEKFSVRDENGNFYTASTFKQPVKPEIYYFPSTLKAITGPHNTSTSFTMDENGIVNFDYRLKRQFEDVAFYNLPSINPVLVLPESYQGFDDRVVSGGNAQYTDHRGDTIASGLFQYCGTKENPLTVVFLGPIDRVSMGRKGESAYTTYVFANPKNTGLENTTIGTWYDVNDGEFVNQNETYVVFCNAKNGVGEKYKIEFTGTEGNELYPVLKSALQENASVHIADPEKNQVACQPSCDTNMLVNTFCFCGASVKTNVEIFGTNLGHEFDLSKGATEQSITYKNYLENGICSIMCARCEGVTGVSIKPVISDFKGYSTKIKSDAITVGYTFDYDALAEYKRINKRDIEFGFVLAIGAFLGDKAPLDGNGNAIDNSQIVKITADVNAYYGYDFKIKGDWSSTVNINGVATQLKDVKLFLCGYAFDGSVNYLQEAGSTTDYSKITQISYNDI